MAFVAKSKGGRTSPPSQLDGSKTWSEERPSPQGVSQTYHWLGEGLDQEGA